MWINVSDIPSEKNFSKMSWKYQNDHKENYCWKIRNKWSILREKKFRVISSKLINKKLFIRRNKVPYLFNFIRVSLYYHRQKQMPRTNTFLLIVRLRCKNCHLRIVLFELNHNKNINSRSTSVFICFFKNMNYWLPFL